MSEALRERLNRAFALFDAGELDAAEAIYREVFPREGLTHDELAQCLMGYGYVLCARGAYAEAEAAYVRLLAMAESKEDEHIALHQIAMVKREAGAYGEALKLIEAEREIIDAAFPRDALKRAVNDYEQGYLRLKKGDLAEAEAWLTNSLFYAERSGAPVAQACAYRALGELSLARGETAAAQARFDAAECLFPL